MSGSSVSESASCETKGVLGPFDATMVVTGAIVGVGIFLTPELVANRIPHGGWILAAWAVGGVIAVLDALTFARLAREVPRAGIVVAESLVSES